MRRRSRLALALALALALGAGAGCKKNRGTDEPEPGTSAGDDGDDDGGSGSGDDSAELPKLTIRITAATDGNAGRPLHVVVRTVTRKAFTEDLYQDVAALVVEPDETVVAVFVVFPGQEQAVTIDAPEGKTVAVYGLFTEATGSSWKRLFVEPEVIELVAGRDRLLTK